MLAQKTPDALPDLSVEIRPLISKLRTSLNAGTGHAILTFIAARPGEGTTTVAYSFARALSADTGKKILLINGNAKEGYSGHGIVECVAAGTDIATALTVVDGVFVGCWSASTQGHALSGRVLQDKAFWQSLQSSFDVIVIDAPSLQASSDGIAFAQASTMTIIVVEAETTRKEVVENLRDTLAASHATIAGLVMNSRKHYIPEKIYKRL